MSVGKKFIATIKSTLRTGPNSKPRPILGARFFFGGMR